MRSLEVINLIKGAMQESSLGLPDLEHQWQGHESDEEFDYAIEHFPKDDLLLFSAYAWDDDLDLRNRYKYTKTLSKEEIQRMFHAFPPIVNKFGYKKAVKLDKNWVPYW